MRLIDWTASESKYLKKEDSISLNIIKKTNTIKKYSITFALFLFCLIVISVIKNETRILQKEISNLQATINLQKFELHKSILDHEILTSPKNISKLANEYLDTDFVTYKKSQILELKKEEKSFTKIKIAKKPENSIKKIKAKINKENLKVKIESKIENKIEKTKSSVNSIKKVYKDPDTIITDPAIKRWAAIQAVKVFFGIPVVPGR